MSRTKLSDRKLPSYTKGEEIFNMVSHIVGGALGIAVVPLCVCMAAAHGNVFGIVSGAIYGFTLIVLYTMSSIYHGLKPKTTAKKVFQIIDHCSIFLLIAGTYTPITLVTLREYNAALGWSMFGLVWAAAAVGITLNAIDLKSFKRFSMICYLAMGWCIVAAIKPMILACGIGGMTFLVTGGILYTIGAVLYALGKKHAYVHSVFHVFVVFGSILHFFCILFYIM
ncbi:MAG: hemolysin III family protein [Clostridia bacterium]|nr:hemolysin III family protein [Clostridia bacterium]